jgi:hypothetical protein
VNTVRAKTIGALIVAGLVVAFPVFAWGAAEPTISFLSPANGSTVAGPKVEVALKIENFRLVAPGGALDEREGHAHILIDTKPPGARKFLSTNDANIVHLGKPPFDSRTVELTEGEHTLYAVLADSEHLVLAGQPAAAAKIVVAPGFRARGPLQPACAEVAQGTGDVRIVFPVRGGAAQGTITTTCSFRTHDGACVWADVSFRRIIGRFDASSGAIQGSASGTSQRRLATGSHSSCGEDQTAAIGSVPVTARRQGAVVQGNVSQARFVLRADPSVTLAQPPPDLAAGDVSAAPASSSKNRGIAFIAFGGAALLLLGIAVYVMRSRDAAKETPEDGTPTA